MEDNLNIFEKGRQPQFLDAHASLYLLVPSCPPVRLSQLASSKDNIHAHPLRPMSYWFANKNIEHSQIKWLIL